jgi:hypothetical protein
MRVMVVNPRHLALFVALALGLSHAAAPLAQPAGDKAATPQAATFTGTFKDAEVTMTVASTGAGFSGTLALGGSSVFPFTASVVDGKLVGNFTSDDKSYAFLAELKGDKLVFKTGSTTYELSRQGAAPAQPQPQPQPQPPPPGGNNKEMPPEKPKPGDTPPPPELPPAGPTTLQQVEAAITRAKQFLYGEQRNGWWDVPARGKEPMPNAQGQINVIDIQNSSQWGGLSALATYALLAGGEDPADQRIAKAVQILAQADLTGTYALAMRAQVWNAMPTRRRQEFLALARRDRDLLLKNMRPDPYKGWFRYSATDQGYDHSASQFAVLGMWACDQMGGEVPLTFWKAVEAAWLKDQDASGGWNYSPLINPPTPVSPSMTAAGTATLFITLDELYGDMGGDCRGNIQHAPIERAIKWLATHYDQVFNNNWPYYTLYGIERVGLASGYKYIGTNDWYRLGVEKLLATQQPNGSWNSTVADTCFGLLFLARGRSPLMVNKLSYALTPPAAPARAGAAADKPAAEPKEGNWNQRPRDVANLSKWMSHQVERELHWQIVTLGGQAEDLHDAPILFISGNQALSFAPAEEQKLRQFVEQGGLVLGHADCSNATFATSFKKLATKLFPTYEFRDLPATHPLFTGPFDRKRWHGVPALAGLSNGARELFLLIPSGDPGRLWQGAAYGGHESAFELLGNIYLYATERRDPRLRGDSWVVAPLTTIAATRTIQVARLEYGGNWDPEPAGWRQLAAHLHNELAIDVVAEPVKLGDGKLTYPAYKVAHLTGTAAFRLSESQRAELKRFIEQGGTLIADAAGGSGPAATSIETEIGALTSERLKLLPTNHPALAQMGMKAPDVALRSAARKIAGEAHGPRIQSASVGGRDAIFYSDLDLSVGLVGQPVDGIIGYAPASATAIVRSLLLFAAPK